MIIITIVIDNLYKY